jgi:hypothetical protein
LLGQKVTKRKLFTVIGFGVKEPDRFSLIAPVKTRACGARVERDFRLRRRGLHGSYQVAQFYSGDWRSFSPALTHWIAYLAQFFDL